ncbi:A/G-specific adenine glycosylase [Sporomusa sp. GT1]|uniref:A/G-specific adenine glycosylase n=1 Tax=Sporomusa sp. GT1 TaxID=1534747 RepID=UPI00166D3FC3|nr:A/G-specific adenine glycosylase [Sporomusa sp. GT1]
MTLATQLLDWYYENARDLPWRQDKDAYKIWVSEIMLQQTRVEAVKGYYQRWIDRFPTPAVLAEASEQEVLQYWQGLGYYSRARNLLAGVREVCAAYGGEVPEDEQLIRQLPGVGDYTAGAIASIAYNRRVPAVDGNVLRIFSRLFCLESDISKQATKREIAGLLHRHMPDSSPGDFNQALMDLGSMICIPRRPRCQVCPLSNLCEGYAREVQDMLPVRPAKKEPVLVQLAAGLVLQDGKYLVRQRPAKGLLAGMWEFPTVELTGGQAADRCLTAVLWHEFGQEVDVREQQFHYIHIFSHRKWDISFFSCQWLSGNGVMKEGQWRSLTEFSNMPWAGPHHKVALALAES